MNATPAMAIPGHRGLCPFAQCSSAPPTYSGTMPVTSGAPVTAGSMVKDAAALLALVFFIPFAILLVGTPVALLIALLLWLGRMASGAF